jgi:quercetin dioxygenase-like cupin family protein
MKSKWMFVLLGVLAVVGVYAGTVLATPPSGQTTTTLARAPLEPLKVQAQSDPADLWRLRLKTHGVSDAYVVGNTFAANGGTSGWHQHPGPSLIFVTAGTITSHMFDGHHCMQHEYTAGQAFVDPGGQENMHMIENNGSLEARTVVVQLIQSGAARRSDADDPCS